jgi:heat shock protein HslJ
MNIVRLGTLVLTLVGYLQTRSPVSDITVTGKLVRLMAMGGESTGWAVELLPGTKIDGKPMNSIQVSYQETGKLEGLQNKRVRATGTLVHRRGVETGEQSVLEVSTIVEAARKSASAAPAAFSLSTSEWLLEDPNGSGVLDSVEATLTFPGPGKAAGHGSCNRFFGPATISGNSMKLGPLASSRKACAEAVMNQEAKYLEALQKAERFEWKDPYLLVYCKGIEKPLRFTRKKAQS